MNRSELKKKYGEEEVLVIPYECVKDLKEGFNESVFDDFKNMLSSSYFIKRYDSDYNPQEVEIIPYPVIMTYDGDEVFCVKRESGSNEARLVDKLSLGIGGHINPEGVKTGYRLVHSSLNRELNEELNLSKAFKQNNSLNFKGLIRITKTDVDKDHIGLLYFLETFKTLAQEKHIDIREKDTLSGSFVSLDFLEDNYDKLENWSKIAFDVLKECNKKRGV